MDIVIISEFCDDFSASDNDRFVYLARRLSTSHDVEIVTSSFRHATKSQRTAPAELVPFDITFIKEPGYPKNVCLERFASHHRWGKNVLTYLKSRKRPDVVYCAVPSLTGPNLVARYCAEQGIRFVIDVQDLWPEAFQMVANIPVASAIAFAPFVALANGIYSRANAICAVSDTYAARALRSNTTCSTATTVFLGTDLATFDAYAQAEPIAPKPDGELWLAYCGTLGSSYDLTCVIDALAQLGNEHVRLVVMGDGPLMEDFQQRSERAGVPTWFTGRIPYDQMCALLARCDIAVNPIAHGAAQSIINKHADYAAASLPVVSTQESAEYRRLVDAYDMGYNCRNNDPADLAAKLQALIDDKGERARMGSNARRCAEERFDRAATYGLLEEALLAG